MAASVYGNCIGDTNDSPCLSCHTDEATLATVHEGVTADKKIPKRLKQTSVGADTCLACHKQEDIREATANSEVLTDDHGTVVNPHDVMELTASHEGLACASCHNPHNDASIAEAAQQTCQGCHHENVYECGTCHEEK